MSTSPPTSIKSDQGAAAAAAAASKRQGSKSPQRKAGIESGKDDKPSTHQVEPTSDKNPTTSTGESAGGSTLTSPDEPMQSPKKSSGESASENAVSPTKSHLKKKSTPPPRPEPIKRVPTPEPSAAIAAAASVGFHPPHLQDEIFLPPSGPVKEAMSPSVAESIRSVFAAFVWHEGIVHDTMAVASYLKFHPTMSKDGSRLTPSKEDASKSIMRQRHSVEVISTAYLKSKAAEMLAVGDSALGGVAESALEKSAMNANANRNISGQSPQNPEGSGTASSSILSSADEIIMSGGQVGGSAKQLKGGVGGDQINNLPPTMRLLVLLWEEIRSYCKHAILHQVSRISPGVL